MRLKAFRVHTVDPHHLLVRVDQAAKPRREHSPQKVARRRLGGVEAGARAGRGAARPEAPGYRLRKGPGVRRPTAPTP